MTARAPPKEHVLITTCRAFIESNAAACTPVAVVTLGRGLGRIFVPHKASCLAGPISSFLSAPPLTGQLPVPIAPQPSRTDNESLDHRRIHPWTTPEFSHGSGDRTCELHFKEKRLALRELEAKDEGRRKQEAMPGSVTPLPLELTGVQIPYHFRCPISLELMRDPVTVSTGQTYDRSSIESWVATGNTTCPVTRAPLTDFTLIPNHTLRRLIQDWCVAHSSQGVERIPTPKQPADPALIRLLISQSAAGDITSRVAALRRIRSLARESDKNRSVISTPETRCALISIAFEELDLSSDLSMEAIAVLSMCSLTESESLTITMVPERLAYLAEAMASPDLEVERRINAAAVIEASSSSSRSSEIRSVVGSLEGVMESFVWMAAMRENARAGRIGIRGIFSLCLAKKNRKRAVEAGAAAAVMRRLGEVKEGELERGLAAVELLCRVEGGREAVVGGAGGGREAVRALVSAMGAGERAAEHAAGALVAVVGASEGLQREAVGAGVVTQLLVMVQSGCSERAKRKAQVLLKLVRSAWLLETEVTNSGDYYFQPY